MYVLLSYLNYSWKFGNPAPTSKTNLKQVLPLGPQHRASRGGRRGGRCGLPFRRGHHLPDRVRAPRPGPADGAAGGGHVSACRGSLAGVDGGQQAVGCARPQVCMVCAAGLSGQREDVVRACSVSVSLRTYAPPVPRILGCFHGCVAGFHGVSEDVCIPCILTSPSLRLIFSTMALLLHTVYTHARMCGNQAPLWVDTAPAFVTTATFISCSLCCFYRVGSVSSGRK